MKRTIYLLLTVLPFFTFGQVVNHFENDDARWYVAANFMNANLENPTHLGVKTTTWGFVGDSLIEGESWRKLYSSADTTLQEDLIFRGFLRSEEDKVFYKKPAASEPRVLYDFGLEVGDYFTFNFENEYEGFEPLAQLQVVEVGTIEIQGETHKIIRFQNHLPDGYPMTMGSVVQEEWIEGIGSLRNPIFPEASFTIDTEWGQEVDVTCTFLGETQYFHNDAYEECYNHRILNISEQELSLFTLYPNPVEKELMINVGQTESFEAEIYNTLGEPVLKAKLSTMNTLLDLEHLTSGVYFIKIKGGEKEQVARFVKR